MDEFLLHDLFGTRIYAYSYGSSFSWELYCIGGSIGILILLLAASEHGGMDGQSIILNVGSRYHIRVPRGRDQFNACLYFIDCIAA